MGRVILVVALLLFLAISWVIRRRQQVAAQRVTLGERLPTELVTGRADRTWILVAAPLCAVCGPAEARLREVDPGATIIRVDAEERPDLVRSLGVRAAPTLLLAGPDGRIRRRVAGPSAVSAHLDVPTTT